MKLSEKWNLTDKEWSILITFPFHISYNISSADGIVNEEETIPYWDLVRNTSLLDENTILVDICKDLMDQWERGIDLSEIYNNHLYQENLLDDDGLYNKKAIIVDYYQPILNLIEEVNREKVIEFCVYLAWETAAYFGRASNPVDEREQQEFFNIFRWLNINTDQYYEGNKRDNYLKKINLLD